MYYTVLTTCSNDILAADLAKKVIHERLAACANIIAAVNSIYVWNDKIENSSEAMISFKTNGLAVDKLMTKIKELHSYETPMIYAHKIEKLDDNYAMWIDNNIRV